MAQQFQPKCKTLRIWLKNNFGRRALAALTGTDSKALDAAVHILELYSYSRDPEILVAFRMVVLAMQDHCRWMAFHAIAHCMEWGDRHPIWVEAGLGIHPPDMKNMRTAAFEPGGTGRRPK